MITRQAIVDEARSWMGTPWMHQARLKGVGVDCIGVPGMSALLCGVPGAREWRDDPAMHSYGRLPREEFLFASCDRFMDRIALSAAGFGDLLVMAFKRYPQHFAIISTHDRTHVIHAYDAVGRVVENGVNVAGARAICAYRFRGAA